MEKLLHINASPHIKSKISTKIIMYLVILALMPTTIYGVIHFGPRALFIVLVSVASAVLSELIFELLMKKEVTIKDGSAALTGLLIGLNMPVGILWWIPVIGSVFAIIVIKQLFGGLGQNFMNPALGARCFLVISFTKYMTDFSYNGINSPTPLSLVKSGESVNTMNMFLGNTQGTIGEISTICILIGALILIAFGIIDLKIPGAYLVTFTLFIIVFGCLAQGREIEVNYICAHLCGGGLMLGAWFMATDYVTSPITPLGKIIFGALCGLLTGLFRLFGPASVTEGVSYSIIIANLLVPIIEKFTIPKPFGITKKEGDKKDE